MHRRQDVALQTITAARNTCLANVIPMVVYYVRAEESMHATALVETRQHNDTAYAKQFYDNCAADVATARRWVARALAKKQSEEDAFHSQAFASKADKMQCNTANICAYLKSQERPLANFAASKDAVMVELVKLLDECKVTHQSPPAHHGLSAIVMMPSSPTPTTIPSSSPSLFHPTSTYAGAFLSSDGGEPFVVVTNTSSIDGTRFVIIATSMSAYGSQLIVAAASTLSVDGS
jgi:hypothetical protein